METEMSGTRSLAEAGAYLRERIWSRFPVTGRNYTRLLALLDIEASTAVPSAAVTLGARSRLLINPEFTARHCAADDDLVMLVMHELMHVALGHTRLFDRVTPARNWAFDCVINAQLCRLYPVPAQTALFRRLYPADSAPLALLRPPEGWRTASERWLPGRAGELHRALYTDESVSYDELFRLLPTLECAAIELGDLLGSHGVLAELETDAALAAEVRRIVAEWPMVQRISGRDQGTDAHCDTVRLVSPVITAIRMIRKCVLSLAGERGGDRSVIVRTEAMKAAVLPYRSGADRRADALLAAGGEPLLYGAALRQAAVAPTERVHVYLDVSGSMSSWLGLLYAALAPLEHLLHPRVHLFSTEVHDVPARRLRHGDVITTSGTDIRAVTAHLVRSRIVRALLVTDGMVGRAPKTDLATLASRRSRIEAVVTPDGVEHEIEPLAARITRLPRLNG